MALKFDHELRGDGILVRLRERNLFGPWKPVPPDLWGDKAQEVALSAIARILAVVAEGSTDAIVQTDGIKVAHAFVARLTEIEAHSISLPPSIPFALGIETEKLITDPRFSISSAWVGHANRILFGERNGAFFKTAGHVYRIPEPLFSIAEAIDDFRNTDMTDDRRRFAVLARLQELFPEEEQERLKLDSYIKRFRVLHASAFSLHLELTADGFQFEPVLFGRRVAERAGNGEEGLISEAESLLTPQLQRIFANHRFARDERVRDRYAIEAGVYVYLDPTLKEALSVVRRMQLADAATRGKFARSPQLFLRTELAGKVEEAELENLFIETEQYSARVVDIGIWEPPVLPWIKREPNSWLPEQFGVQIDDKYIAVEPSDLGPLRTAIEEALRSGSSTVAYKGEQIPASRRSLDALSSLIGEVRPDGPRKTVEREEKQPAQKHVLIINENFEQVDFIRKLSGRISVALPRGAPAALRAILKPHQESGVNWLRECWTRGYPGVLLADDMGLGKTLQALTFLAALREGTGSRQTPIMIVAPTGLLENWVKEHDQHLYNPGLGELRRAYGRYLSSLKRERSSDVLSGIPCLDTELLRSADWILTTYETLRDYHLSFAAVPFRAVVYDEMQKVKNPASLNSRAAKTINADFVLGMTGTPIENQLEDLWSIMDIIDPGRLGDLKSFSRTYSADDPNNLEQLRTVLLDGSSDAPPVVFRRLKVDHLPGLPEKVVHVRRRIMPDQQAKAYAIAVAQVSGGDGDASMLEVLHQLRGVSLHPVWPHTGSLADIESYVAQSARLIETFAILDDIAHKGEKVLIFLESLDMQDRLALIIKVKHRLSSLPLQINGAVSGEKRQKAVDDFQTRKSGFDVMILSPKAGGVGLTLTSANHVIHLSRWWNPAVEDQCTDRIYRIGQDQTVHVYYPMAIHPSFGDGTFDVLLNAMLEEKRDLGRRMLIPPVNAKRDEAWFAAQLGRKPAVDVGEVEPVDLDEIDRLEPLGFERWVLRRLANSGYVADRTPRSYDGGADGLVVHRESGKRILVQCKHRQSSDAVCDEQPIDDLIRAKSAYRQGAIELVALTNAIDFTPKAKRLAAANGVVLVHRDQLRSWPAPRP